MYNIGDIVTLLINKTEGAGVNSLNISAGITGMIVNAGRACGASYSYIIDFGPEGQWNCRHDELRSLSANVEDEEEGWDDIQDEDEEDGFDEDEEIEEDISEEEAGVLRLAAGEVPGRAPNRWTHEYEAQPEQEKIQSKKISFEEDLAKMIAVKQGRKG